MINNAPNINSTKLCIFLRNIKRHSDYYSTLSEEQKNNPSLKKAIIESYTREESTLGSYDKLGSYKRWQRTIPLNEESLQLLPKQLQTNNAVAKKIITHNPSLYKFLDDKLKLDDQLIKCFFENILVGKNTFVSNKIMENVLNDIENYFPGFSSNKETCLKVCKMAINAPYVANYVYSSIFPMIPANMKTDKDFITRLLKEDYNLYKYIPQLLQDDFNMMIDAMKFSNGQVFGYFHKELKSDLFFSHYMSQFGEIDGYDLSGELRKQYMQSNDTPINSFLSSLMLKEKLEKETNEKKYAKTKNKI